MWEASLARAFGDTMAESRLDVKGLLCPLPVLKARKRLQSLASGDELVLEATDPASVIDVPHFCRESGHVLMESGETNGVYRFRIRKA